MEILRGKRNNTFVYVYDGYSYNKDSKNPKIYRCSGRQTNKCTGTLIQKDEYYILQKSHTHPNEPCRAEILKLKSAILEECSKNPSVNNKDIFDNICRTNPDAATHISYNSMKSIMSREKRKSRPDLPKTVQSAHEILQNYDVLKEIYMGCAISNNNKYALIFSNNTLLTALENAKEIYMDGTFSVVPRMPTFHQLYTLHIRYNDTGIATIFILSECRTKAMYEAIWEKVVSLVPRLKDNLQTVMCDYERAAMDSVQSQFPRVTIHGCWFHFTQALLRKWKMLGLQGAPSEILSMAMTMPLAPSNMFPEALYEIQLVADRLCGTFPNVLLFTAYLRNVWLPISCKVSVYGSPVRTNNLVESFHSAVIRKFKTVHPNFWFFIDNLTNLIADQETNYKRLLKNENIRSIRTRTNKAKNKKITTSQENLISGTLPLGQFLRFFSEDYKQEHYESDLMSTDSNENDKCNELLPKTTFFPGISFSEEVPTANVEECNEFPKITFLAEAATIASVNTVYKKQPTQTTATSNIEDYSGAMLTENHVCTQNIQVITTHGENKDCQEPILSKETLSSNMSPQVITTDGENKDCQKPILSKETLSSNMSPQVVLEKICIQTQRRKSLR